LSTIEAHEAGDPIRVCFGGGVSKIQMPMMNPETQHAHFRKPNATPTVPQTFKAFDTLEKLRFVCRASVCVREMLIRLGFLVVVVVVFCC
jgi:hypothetical protein